MPKTYAIAHLQDVRMGPEIAEYLGRIDETLEPFDGRFLVHGMRHEVLEGEWPGDLVIIEFPDRARAEAWYSSERYQQILPLRVRNSDSNAIIIDGNADDHRGADLLAELSG
ncbi:DUF1330 domain-containing protein [Solirubrobacter sp. CPCC 204708]|uniref:DUF1330 domain-containing protein n=1 Tax=Solirubrobacter deserti TaxID=2282478 RepID=A0ABT4RQH9_9ACTN|nr:DUF1330 domain-containing protein [Solirubrobacter deserti]MBE2320629.1 DUF1330 domain-containing protein [Solirubrobacter deserti]MDA0140683.1 DUF1330 domain-containing protein [Solirubrobacter deserti]